MLTGIDSVGKSSEIAKLPWKLIRKYPNDEEIKAQINNLLKVLVSNEGLT